MRDCRVDKGKEFSFCLRGVVEDFLGDVNEAQHYSVNLTIISLDIAFLNLKELELWNVSFGIVA